MTEPAIMRSTDGFKVRVISSHPAEVQSPGLQSNPALSRTAWCTWCAVPARVREQRRGRGGRSHQQIVRVVLQRIAACARTSV
eukprot:6202590-Pleurochrysis_carterae.AAC.5